MAQIGLFRRSWPALLVSIVCLLAGATAATWHRLPENVADSAFYRELAHGAIDRVPEPFNRRILVPLVVRGLVGLGLFDTDRSFVFCSVLALAIIASVVGCLAARETIHPFWIPAILATPYTLDIFAGAFLPDLFHAALLSAAILALVRKCFWGLATLLFLATLCRESTVLAATVLVFLALRRRLMPLITGVASAVASALIFVGFLTRHAPGNGHGLPSAVYLAMKVPYNGLKNLLGIEFWSNSFTTLPAWQVRNPVWTLSLPEQLRLGHVREIGLMPWIPVLAFDNTTLMLTLFGLWPAVCLAAHGTLKPLPEKGAEWNDHWLQWCMVYGTIAFVAGPFLGASVSRLVGYGWPAFWLAGPVLLRRLAPAGRLWALLTLGSLGVAWLPLVVAALHLGFFTTRLLVFLPSVIGWVISYRLVRLRVSLAASQTATFTL